MPMTSGSSEEIEEDRQAFARQFAHELVHRRLRADVDALGRLVENEDARVRSEPFADDDLLLVAAGQLAQRLLPVRRLDREARAECSRRRQFLGVGR